MTARRAAREVSDAEILKRIAGGELGALGELYDRHERAVRRFVHRAISGGADVDDLVHATFMTAAQSAARYDGRTSSRPWLIGISVVLLRRRRTAFRRFIAVLSALQRRSAPDPRPELDLRRDLSRALARLSDAKRITILMAEVEGFSCAEIAVALEVPIGTVWTRLHAARRELRESLGEP